MGLLHARKRGSRVPTARRSGSNSWEVSIQLVLRFPGRAPSPPTYRPTLALDDLMLPVLAPLEREFQPWALRLLDSLFTPDLFSSFSVLQNDLSVAYNRKPRKHPTSRLPSSLSFWLHRPLCLLNPFFPPLGDGSCHFPSGGPQWPVNLPSVLQPVWAS